MTNDQQQRHAAFVAAFQALPGKTNADRIRYLRQALGDAAPSKGTVHQYLMREPHRVPSRQMVALVRSVVPASQQ